MGIISLICAILAIMLFSTLFPAIILAIVSIITGIIAIAKNSGRRIGVFSVILSIVFLIAMGSLAGYVKEHKDAGQTQEEVKENLYKDLSIID